MWQNAFYTLNKQCRGNYERHVLGGKQSIQFSYTGKEHKKKYVDVITIKPTLRQGHFLDPMSDSPKKKKKNCDLIGPFYFTELLTGLLCFRCN